GAGEDAAGRDQWDVELLLAHPVADLGDDGGEVVLRPVQPEAEVAAGERALDYHVVGHAPGAGAFLEEELQCAQRADDDAELYVAEARMVLDEGEGSQ